MNETYVPKDAVAFRAAKWEYDEPAVVAKFIKLLIDHNLTFHFDTVYDGSTVQVEVEWPRTDTRAGQAVTVDNYEWLAVKPDGTLEIYTDYVFTQKFRKA